MRKEEVEKLLDRSEKTLKVTKTLIEEGYFGDAVSKAYYAMFYAGRALLIQNGIIRHKHASTLSAIGQFFVKTGKLKPELHQILIAAFEDREMADYNIDWNASAEESESRYLTACKFVEAIKKLV